MSAKVLVLGGYGTTGTTLSELLLEYGDAEIVLAGRNRAKGEKAAAALNERFPGRATARVADAADAASLARAFDRIDLVAAAALNAGADWNAYALEIDTINELADELKGYRVEALRDGAWSKLAWRDATRAFDFGPPYGSERCAIMFMEELRLLPEQIPSLRDCAFFSFRASTPSSTTCSCRSASG